jgi:hypothetical protein
MDSGGFLQTECGVIDKEGKYIDNSGMFGIPVPETMSFPDNIETIDKEVIWGGRIFLHYGHFLLQSTTRLYQYIKNKEKNPYIVFTIGSGEKLPKFAVDFFALLAIPKDRIILIDKWTRFKKIICPSLSSITRYQASAKLSSENFWDWTDDFVLPFREAAKKVEPSKHKKVYFTRRYWTGIAQCLGESDVEKVFIKNGFKSFAPEKLSLKKEQIALIKGADVIAGVNGSPFHNALFADKPNLKLIMLNRNEEFDFQVVICEVLKADWYVIKAYANPFLVSESHGPFIISMTQYLRDFCRDHNFKDFDIELNVAKYLKDFCYLYVKVYSEEYNLRTLECTGKGQVNARDLIAVIETANYSLLKRAVYYALYHLTFGALKVKYRNRHRALEMFAYYKKTASEAFGRIQ